MHNFSSNKFAVKICTGIPEESKLCEISLYILIAISIVIYFQFLNVSFLKKTPTHHHRTHEIDPWFEMNAFRLRASSVKGG